MGSNQVGETSKPLVIVGLVALVLVLLVGGYFLVSKFTRSDLDGVTVHPKPWAPPGGADRFKPGASRGAPASQPGTGTTG
ncbi:MAG TPA: hypothetical protein VKT78_09755 [Fimbriimonadaceae bacterium]|nr:hypothetical protein [Fimbriimonadaceae bacterium]